MVDRRLAFGLQLAACVLAVAFIADEWSDHTLRARIGEWFESRRLIVEPEPVAEVMPSSSDVQRMHTEARRITEGRLFP